jgi:carboxypeptidase Q
LTIRFCLIAMGTTRTTVLLNILLLLWFQQWVQASTSVIQMATEGEIQLKINAKGDADTVIHAAFNTTIVYERLAYMTDTFGPRFSGTPALESALDWIKVQAQTDGLSVKEQPVMIPVWVRGREYANLISPRRKSMHVLGLGGSVGTNGQIVQAKVLVVSSFDDLERQKDNVKGKIVVYNVEFVSYGKTVVYRVNGASKAQQYGAVAALVRSISPFGLQTPHTGSSEPTTIPAMAITLEDAQMFARMQARGQEVEIELYMEAHTLPDAQSRNLILEIEGTHFPSEYVIVGGHTDSWDIADGAMDDGGGAFVAWEALRLIKSSGLHPDRTVRAILYVNEENGARGGQQYAHDYSDTLSKTSIALESDVGTFTPDGISFLGSTKAQSILEYMGHQLLGGIGSGNVSGEGIGEDISYMCVTGVPCGNLNVLDPRVGTESNNPCAPYSQPPYPLLTEDEFPRDGYFWYHHTEADTIDKLSPEQLQHAAATLGVWIYSIANLPTLLPR